MSIENRRQLENAREKLRLLEESLTQLKQHPGANAYVDELTLRSLHSQINDIKEDIARYRTHAVTGAEAE
jgi:uncharacterized protein YigA (DUF484 family)